MVAPLERVPGVEVFATGEYPQGRYTLTDLTEMVRNLKKVGPRGLRLHEAPVGIGHEDDQKAAKELARTDTPALGVIDADTARVVPYRVGKQWHGTLVADFSDVTPEVADAIRSKRYRRVSAEVYDDFADDFGNSHGKTIRRVSLLGFEPSGVKRTANLPMPVKQFNEGNRGRLRVVSRIPSGPGRFLCFAEFQPMPMDISAVIAAVKKVVPDLADDKLAGLSELLKALGGESVPEMPEAPEMPEPAEAFGEADRAAIIGELTGMGQDPTALAAMTDDELKSLKNTLMAPPVATPDAAMGEAKKMFAEAAKLLADVKAKAAVVSKFAEQAAKDRRKDQVAGVVSDLLKLGKVTPAEAPAVTDRLSRADAVKVFGEKGKETTEFAAQVAELYARPVVVKFGEKLADNHPAIDNETAKVQQWADRNADALKRAGKSPAEYVKTFSEVLKANPQMTAAKFGVPA